MRVMMVAVMVVAIVVVMALLEQKQDALRLRRRPYQRKYSSETHGSIGEHLVTILGSLGTGSLSR